MASTLPFAAAYPRSLAIDGQATPPDEVPQNVSYVTIGSHYFETLRLRLLADRSFSELDGTPGHESAIVNERFVDRFFPQEDPLGRRIRLTNTNVFAATLPWVTIVGVTPTVRQASFAGDTDPVVYLPFRGDAGYFASLVVQPRTDVSSAPAAIREEIAALDPEIPLFALAPLDQVMAGSRACHRSILMMIGVFAVLALVLAALGLYAVTAYAVAQRTHEIGIRVAIGARASQVVWLFVRQGVVTLAVGLVIGLAGASVLGRVLGSLLVGTSATDPLTLMAVATLLLVVGMAAARHRRARNARGPGRHAWGPRPYPLGQRSGVHGGARPAVARGTPSAGAVHRAGQPVGERLCGIIQRKTAG